MFWYSFEQVQKNSAKLKGLSWERVANVFNWYLDRFMRVVNLERQQTAEFFETYRRRFEHVLV